MSVTVNDVRDGVIRALAAAFPEVEIYGEEIKQGLESACFFVQIIQAGQDRELGRRYKRIHSFDIHYFKESNEECHAVAETLYSCLRRITLPSGSCAGTGMNYEIIDRVMHFFVQYNFHVIEQQADATKMQTLEQEGAIKNGGE